MDEDEHVDFGPQSIREGNKGIGDTSCGSFAMRSQQQRTVNANTSRHMDE